ncbi:S-adenosyl-L-methionine-dependent methyltransferases superfamily protein [Raphanus sativus]|nr:S-adenosyl-L-methionine-dependent methyltransferases superfamily protein [Raphanus sativus]KAJ4871969.1 S-adenosyl-L-methionine-dependent methyltransferases superfamily protein [Raphanus sativus]
MARETSSTQSYSEKWYWDDRYTNESDSFDWYQNYSSLSPLINLYLPPHPTHRSLVIGCGNSAFSEGMVDAGYEDVVNIDISSVVIDAMNKKHSDRPQLKYLKMDVRDMKAFEDASFDAVIDKGTLDSILCGSNSRQHSTQMIEEVWRVLKDKGVYILITYGAPNYRLRLFKESSRSWTTKLHVIETPRWELTKPIPLDDEGSSVESAIGKSPDVHYIYVCIKDEALKTETEAVLKS